MIELLVSISIIAVTGLAMSMSVIQSFRTAKFIEINHIANTLALGKIEEFAAKDTVDITAALNSDEPAITWPDFGITFRRVSNVVVNADNSRTVTVTVSSNYHQATTVSLVTTFAMWE